jgi:hypothetical protein
LAFARAGYRLHAAAEGCSDADVAHQAPRGIDDAAGELVDTDLGTPQIRHQRSAVRHDDQASGANGRLGRFESGSSEPTKRARAAGKHETRASTYQANAARN